MGCTNLDQAVSAVVRALQTHGGHHVEVQRVGAHAWRQLRLCNVLVQAPRGPARELGAGEIARGWAAGQGWELMQFVHVTMTGLEMELSTTGQMLTGRYTVFYAHARELTGNSCQTASSWRVLQ